MKTFSEFDESFDDLFEWFIYFDSENRKWVKEFKSKNPFMKLGDELYDELFTELERFISNREMFKND
jgi:hypothetical protein